MSSSITEKDTMPIVGGPYLFYTFTLVFLNIKLAAKLFKSNLSQYG